LNYGKTGSVRQNPKSVSDENADNWISEITHMHEPEYFIDEQRFGPYRFWHLFLSSNFDPVMVQLRANLACIYAICFMMIFLDLN
jgi:hypothetical protein